MSGPGPTGRAGSPSEQVETTLFRDLSVLRAVVLVYALVLNAVRFGELARPVLGAAALAVMVLWSGFATWAYAVPRRRRTPLFAADLLVAVLLVLSTRLVHTPAMLERHASTVPSFWVMVPVLAWAVGRRTWEAVAAAVVVSLADLSTRVDAVGPTWGNIFLLILAAGVVSYTAHSLRDAAEMRASAERDSAAAAERARLARAVHDGVLQVLALVQRAGADRGADLAGLARLAREQEAALRTLVQHEVRALDGRPATADADLAAALGDLQSASVTVSTPGRPVPLAASTVEELVAVVRACLANVTAHVGPEAPAWVLVEDLGDRVEVSVRDAGPGIPPGRLEEAAREGRLGVSQSICGRMADLGGEAVLVPTAGAGTEWELRLPRTAGGTHG
jgi:signal transduction histidine kinase